MQRRCIEQQRVPCPHLHSPAAIAVADLPGQKVQELQARMLKGHIGIGIRQQRDQVGLDEQVARQQVAQQLVAVV
ncbi:hypothetical protein D9M68_1005300 [compost metagenome]